MAKLSLRERLKEPIGCYIFPTLTILVVHYCHHFKPACLEHSFDQLKTGEIFLSLTRPIVFFDLETTGTSTTKDRIVELFALRLHPDGRKEERHHLVNPSIPIPAAATAVHGITNEMVAGKPLFAQIADELAAFFEGCDLGGFNIRRFDVPMLMEEFHRLKKYPININDVKLVDAMGIFHNKEKRDLSAAVKFYCQREHESAHSARADVLATLEILKQQLIRYEDLEPNSGFLHDYLSAGTTVDISGKFRRDEGGRIIFNFGKHFGKVAGSESAYLKWMVDEGDFPVDTKMVAKKIYMHGKWEEEIITWMKQARILSNPSGAAVLYSCIRYEKDVFPFSNGTSGGKRTITFLDEPPRNYIFPHQDAVGIFLKLLDNFLREKGEATI